MVEIKTSNTYIVATSIINQRNKNICTRPSMAASGIFSSISIKYQRERERERERERDEGINDHGYRQKVML
jgi:hypothetical protein